MSTFFRFSSNIALLAVCAFAVGCGESDKGPLTVPAEGVVTLDGNPCGGATVVFITDSGTQSATAMTDSAGHFSLNAFEYKTGAIPGEYKVIVRRTVEILSATTKAKGEEAEHAAEGGEEGVQLGIKNDLPKKYGTPSENFKFTIPDTGITDLKLELKS